jgi:hypothetical protein
LFDQCFRFQVLVQHDADLFDRTEDTVEVAWIGYKNGDVLVLQLLGEDLELGCSRDQDHLRVQGDDSFQAWMKRVAYFRNVVRFGREVAIGRVAYKAITGANRENDLGQVRSERDYALDLRRESYVAARVVFDLPC